jgi:hypothetical protein
MIRDSRRSEDRAREDAMTKDGEFGRWISDLRDRLTRGDLADLNAPDGSAANDPAWRQERLCGLHEDFRRLRELLG